MTTPEDTSGDKPYDSVVAGEYVLGTLSRDARQTAEARMRSDPAFAALVHAWQARLEPLDEEYGEVTPPAYMRGAIETRLFGTGKEKQGFVGRAWDSVALWRGVAAVAIIFAVAFLASERFLSEAQPTLLAELSGPDNAVNLVARYNARNGIVTFTPVAAGAADERSLELWLIAGEDAPLSLGVLPQTGEGEIAVPRTVASRIDAGASFAVTIEPFGGSPSGAPTGPVIAAGELRSL
ncbi:anti-sigma factor [Martelella mediterranea]|uniref:Putative anti-sigmaE protein n=1 Tax=Martelella mediterranea DSM 17316 TaxID=1122214 RepID=A0A1U9Z1V8_9HYPH|nr:anti-sigma factor [Martelella mediterranea]AQZ51683.1 putative anti-sigmaE protein [Martelella mediterranea DSM 17316]